MQTLNDSGVPKRSEQNVLIAVLRNAVTNTGWFIIGTVAIILIGHVSRGLGIALALIETLFAALQSIKVLFIVVADIMIFLAVRCGKRRREDDEAEIRWATFVRVAEIGIWTGCLLVLYRYFF
jgi:hypothetical protein